MSKIGVISGLILSLVFTAIDYLLLKRTLELWNTPLAQATIGTPLITLGAFFLSIIMVLTTLVVYGQTVMELFSE